MGYRGSGKGCGIWGEEPGHLEVEGSKKPWWEGLPAFAEIQEHSVLHCPGVS